MYLRQGNADISDLLQYPYQPVIQSLASENARKGSPWAVQYVPSVTAFRPSETMSILPDTQNFTHSVPDPFNVQNPP